MIGRIAGVILHRAADQVLIDVRGVGYIVHVSARTAASLPPAGEAAALYTELLVREDLLQLFGFPTLLEKEWHRLLTTVQGVGAKASMAILGTLGPEGVGRAIALGDWNAVKAAPGVGPKLAQRVVMELKDKVGGVTLGSAGALPKAAGGFAADAVSALANLGFRPAEAGAAVAAAEAELGTGATLDALVRLALKKAGK